MDKEKEARLESRASPSHCHSSTYSSPGGYHPPADPDANVLDHLLEDDEEVMTAER